MLLREKLEEKEKQLLSEKATLSCESMGRIVAEAECNLRPAFQHDRDRIIHSKAFRRLIHKTQVFLAPGGDHYRTRLTHTLEVSQIARTISKSLFLNEDLTEAIALGHDLGHTPFGHAGEAVLNRIVPKGFKHPDQSLRVVDEIEKLNLTREVRDGILKHSKRGGPIFPEDKNLLPATREGQVVRIADSIAYLNHDLDDALRAKVITEKDLDIDVKDIMAALGNGHSERIDRMVNDVIQTTRDAGTEQVLASDNIMNAAMGLRRFLEDRVYNGMVVHRDFEKASKIVEELYAYYISNPEAFYTDSGKNFNSGDPEQDVCDFISGMTDRYAFKEYERIFLPQPWLLF